MLVEIKYRATLKRAHEMARGDASSYDEIWKTFVADEIKIKALSSLVDANCSGRWYKYLASFLPPPLPS